MSFQDDPHSIRWRLHLKSPPERVYQALSTDAGRASFWAEAATEQTGIIHFVFPNGISWHGRILHAEPPFHFTVQYFGNSVATFTLQADGSGGTDLSLSDNRVLAEDRSEVVAGWVSVLMALKGTVDFCIDLRTHDPQRNWDNGYVEN